MNRGLTVALTFVLVAPLLLSAVGRSSEKKGAQLAHMVFFTLKDHSNESREKFVASCQKYLGNIEGTVYFSVGTIADDVDEPVSVKDFDVALHVVFESKDAKLMYLKNPRHDEFVQVNKDSWSKVRVFDSYLAAH